MMRDRKVLVIDDSEVVLFFVTTVLTEAGFQVSTRNTPFGTGAAILREQPALVLLDVTMPALSGEDVVQHVRGHQALRSTRIVLYSDRPESELAAIAARAGADGWIRKSSDVKALVDGIETILAQERRPQSHVSASGS